MPQQYVLGDPAPAAPRACQSCGSAAVERDYLTPLCRACRDRLSCRPLPLWINLVALLTAAAVVLSFFRFPGSLSAGVAFERGRRAERAGHCGAAVVEYQKVLRSYPDATEPLARLAISQYRAGDVNAALLTVNRLNGRSVSKELAGEVGEILSGANRPPDAAPGGGAP